MESNNIALAITTLGCGNLIEGVVVLRKKGRGETREEENAQQGEQKSLSIAVPQQFMSEELSDHLNFLLDTYAE